MNFYATLYYQFYLMVDRFHALFLSLCVLLERRDCGKVAFHTAAGNEIHFHLVLQSTPFTETI